VSTNLSTHPERLTICFSASTQGRRRRRRKGSLVQTATTNYKGFKPVESVPLSTTDEILNDPIWRQRIFDSLEQVRRGQTRPIEEYLAESDNQNS
jgi:hypothetical protein